MSGFLYFNGVKKMRFTTKTEYGLNCLVHMARQKPGEVVTIKDMAGREGFSVTYVEKILQRLRSKGIVTSHSGKNGGFALNRNPANISLKEIIEALEGSTFDVFCEPKVRNHIVCTHFCLCGIRPVWAKTKELLDNFFSSVTLEILAKQEGEAQALVSSFGKESSNGKENRNPD